MFCLFHCLNESDSIIYCSLLLRCDVIVNRLRILLVRVKIELFHLIICLPEFKYIFYLLVLINDIGADSKNNSIMEDLE